MQTRGHRAGRWSVTPAVSNSAVNEPDHGSASNSIHEAEALTNRHPNAKSMRIDVTDIVEVDGLVAQADLVIRPVCW